MLCSGPVRSVQTILCSDPDAAVCSAPASHGDLRRRRSRPRSSCGRPHRRGAAADRTRGRTRIRRGARCRRRPPAGGVWAGRPVGPFDLRGPARMSRGGGPAHARPVRVSPARQRAQAPRPVAHRPSAGPRQVNPRAAFHGLASDGSRLLLFGGSTGPGEHALPSRPPPSPGGARARTWRIASDSIASSLAFIPPTFGESPPLPPPAADALDPSFLHAPRSSLSSVRCMEPSRSTSGCCAPHPARGDRGGPAGSGVYLADLFAWEPATLTWSKLPAACSSGSPTGPSRPAARAHHGLAAGPSGLYVFGGEGPEGDVRLHARARARARAHARTHARTHARARARAHTHTQALGYFLSARVRACTLYTPILSQHNIYPLAMPLLALLSFDIASSRPKV